MGLGLRSVGFKGRKKIGETDLKLTEQTTNEQQIRPIYGVGFGIQTRARLVEGEQVVFTTALTIRNLPSESVDLTQNSSFCSTALMKKSFMLCHSCCAKSMMNNVD